MPDALVLAADGGVAKVVGQAGAHAPLAHAALLRVGPARVRLAGVAGRPLGAPLEGVALVVGPALADGPVVVGVAVGVLPAGSGAGVHALVSDTCLVCWTVVVDCTLRLTLSVRVSKHFRQACARCSTISFVAYCIDATWRRIAGIYDLWPRWLSGNSVASAEGISLVSLVADTNGHMVSDSAVSISSTEARTGVLTFSVDTCSFRGTV